MRLVLASRLIAVALVFAAVWTAPRNIFLYGTIALAFSHYLSALLFSPARVKWFAASPAGWGSAALIAVTSVAITRFSFPNWAIYGIFHYLTSDVRAARSESEGFWLGLRGRLIVNGLAAAVMFRKELGIATVWVPAVLWVASLIALAIAIGKRSDRGKDWPSLAGFEAIVVLLTIFSLFKPITFNQASLAHFLFWTCLTAGQAARKGVEPLANFLGPVLAIAFAVYLLTPVGLFPKGWSQAKWITLWTYGSNFHITASFFFTAAMQRRLSSYLESGIRVPALLARKLV